MTTAGKQTVSTLNADNTVTIEVITREWPAPTGNQVLVRMEAAPINPSDLFLMTMAADLANAQYSPGKIVAPVDPAYAAAQKLRHGQRMDIGNEGAGEVVAAGDGPMAQALLGQRVACVPGHAFSQYALADAMMCLPLGEHSSEAGAASFVNPMTALGFAETTRRDAGKGGGKALLHLAAASSLGQMLNRICQEDGLELVNIVRREQQAELLREQGASHVVNSSGEDFIGDLARAIDQTDAFIGFDPIGGGDMSDKCLRAMERVAAGRMSEFSRYGSEQMKRMYIYGRLDMRPTTLSPAYGFGWSVSGWLLMPFLASLDMSQLMAMRQRVLDGLTTTFASHYKAKVNLEEMLSKDAIMDYAQMKTGEKYLVVP